MDRDNRVIKFPEHYAVHEVTYNEFGVPISYNPEAVRILNPDFIQFIETVHGANANFAKPVINVEDFPREQNDLPEKV